MTLQEKAAARRRFAEEHGFTPCQVESLVRYGDLAGKAQVAALNGDPFGFCFRGDKSENARRWEAERDRLAALMEEIAGPKGFQVEFNGCYPNLTTTGSDSVFLPYDTNC